MRLEALKSRLERPDRLLGRERCENFVVFIPVVELDGRDALLFQKRAAGIRQAGEICFPGGARDPAADADEVATAVRETCEELGLEASRVRPAGKLGVLMSSSWTAIDAYIGVLDIAGLDELRPNPREVERVFTAPVEELRGMRPEIHQVRIEQHSFELDRDGGRREIFPARQLGLPERYHESWGKRLVPVRIYRVAGEIVWGLTAELVAEALKIL